MSRYGPLSARRDAFRELAIFAAAYLVYFGVRAMTEGTVGSAMQNATDVIRFEQQLGVAWERAVQEVVRGRRCPGWPGAACR